MQLLLFQQICVLNADENKTIYNTGNFLNEILLMLGIFFNKSFNKFSLIKILIININNLNYFI